jgi:hypothetical protein
MPHTSVPISIELAVALRWLIAPRQLNHSCRNWDLVRKSRLTVLLARSRNERQPARRLDLAAFVGRTAGNAKKNATETTGFQEPQASPPHRALNDACKIYRKSRNAPVEGRQQIADNHWSCDLRNT